ncbi:hypothetical protein WA588_000624 [Blastocystis sp. NMH]
MEETNLIGFIDSQPEKDTFFDELLSVDPKRLRIDAPTPRKGFVRINEPLPLKPIHPVSLSTKQIAAIIQERLKRDDAFSTNDVMEEIVTALPSLNQADPATPSANREMVLSRLRSTVTWMIVCLVHSHNVDNAVDSFELHQDGSNVVASPVVFDGK